MRLDFPKVAVALTAAVGILGVASFALILGPDEAGNGKSEAAAASGDCPVVQEFPAAVAKLNPDQPEAPPQPENLPTPNTGDAERSLLRATYPCSYSGEGWDEERQLRVYYFIPAPELPKLDEATFGPHLVRESTATEYELEVAQDEIDAFLRDARPPGSYTTRTSPDGNLILRSNNDATLEILRRGGDEAIRPVAQ